MGAKTVTDVEEFLTAARRGPPAALMAATSCLRPAPFATERMEVALGTAGVRVEVVFDGWATDTPSSRIRLQMTEAMERVLGAVKAMAYSRFLLKAGINILAIGKIGKITGSMF